MPSVVIHVRREYSELEEVAIMNAVHAALMEAFGLGSDGNVILIAHKPHRFICPGKRDDPSRYTNVSIVGHASRPMEAKRTLYKAIIANLAAVGIPRNCVLIQLHEIPAHDIGVQGGQPLSDLLEAAAFEAVQAP